MSKHIWNDDDSELPTMSWLIDAVMPLGEIGAIYGRTQTYKSSLALDMACHVARGMTWNGHAVTSGTVVYVAAEAQTALRTRNHAWRQYHRNDKAPICFFLSPILISDDDKVDEFMDEIDKACTKEQVPPPSLIIIDTYHKCMAGQDENDAGTAAQAFNNLERLKETYDATILLIHHPGRGKDVHMRGSSCLDTDLDFIYYSQKNKDRTLITLSNEKMRSGEQPEDEYRSPKPFRLTDGKDCFVLVEPERTAKVQAVKEQQEAADEALKLILAVKGHTEWSTTEGQTITQLTKRTWYRTLSRWVETKKAEKVGHGSYSITP